MSLIFSEDIPEKDGWYFLRINFRDYDFMIYKAGDSFAVMHPAYSRIQYADKTNILQAVRQLHTLLSPIGDVPLAFAGPIPKPAE